MSLSRYEHFILQLMINEEHLWPLKCDFTSNNILFWPFTYSHVLRDKYELNDETINYINYYGFISLVLRYLFTNRIIDWSISRNSSIQKWKDHNISHSASLFYTRVTRDG
jgi:hypothetical protein